MTTWEITVQPPFSFDECLRFLSRSDKEIMHVTSARTVSKLLAVPGRHVLFDVQAAPSGLRVSSRSGALTEEERTVVTQYIEAWFDLDRDLSPIGEVARRDELLAPLWTAYEGLRLIGLPNLFEALVWAIIGQQITLSFAYTIKRRFVETYGTPHIDRGVTYWAFPDAAKIARLTPDALRDLQCSQRKAEYILDIANMIAAGTLSHTHLATLTPKERRDALLALRGVGAWTADYVLMKCFRDAHIFLVGDAGLRQALEQQLHRQDKLTPAEMGHYAARFVGIESYATFYLWRSLYGTEDDLS